MAVFGDTQSPVGTTATELSLPGGVNRRVTLTRKGGGSDGASAYYIGSFSGVTTSTGLKVTTGRFTFDLGDGDTLYVVTASGQVYLSIDVQYGG